MGNGKFAVVDEDDYRSLSERKWVLNTHGYPVARIDDRIVRMHRLVMRAADGVEVDHINMDRVDCRKSNLRLALPSENRKNVRKRAWTSYKGVGVRNGKWYARIGSDGKRTYGPPRTDAADAARDYDELARRLHGQFARLNFPGDGEQPAT